MSCLIEDNFCKASRHHILSFGHDNVDIYACGQSCVTRLMSLRDCARDRLSFLTFTGRL